MVSSILICSIMLSIYLYIYIFINTSFHTIYSFSYILVNVTSFTDINGCINSSKDKWFCRISNQEVKRIPIKSSFSQWNGFEVQFQGGTDRIVHQNSTERTSAAFTVQTNVLQSNSIITSFKFCNDIITSFINNMICD